MDVKASPFGSFEGMAAYEFVPGVHLRAVGGDQVLLCKVTYETEHFQRDGFGDAIPRLAERKRELYEPMV